MIQILLGQRVSQIPEVSGQRVSVSDRSAIHQTYAEVLNELRGAGYGHALSEDEITELVLGRLASRLKGLQRFRGVYAAGELPADFRARRRPGHYAVLNTRKRSTGGEHWLAVCDGDDGAGTTARYVYDSFGRTPAELGATTFAGRKWTMTEPTPEQEVYEVDCAARCLAWLCAASKFGPRLAAAAI